MKFKKKNKRELYERVKEIWYNTSLSIDALANKFGKSRRTIYQWIKRAQRENPTSKRKIKKRDRPPKYPKKVYCRIKEIKLENPRRSAPMVRRILKN
ncbi:MAG: helix-turn-helix domain-containing protein [Promethearchaeia archaeon]